MMKWGRKRPNHSRNRQAAGTNTSAATQTAHGSWYSVEVRVHNVSQCGFMAQCPDVIDIGSSVPLGVPGIGPVSAAVRWQIGSRMGGTFVDPISRAPYEWTAVKAAPPPGSP